MAEPGSPITFSEALGNRPRVRQGSASPDFSQFVPPHLRQPLNEIGALGYQLYDNVVGIDDDYDSMGELLARSLRDDPVGTAKGIATGVIDSAKAAYEDPMGTLSALGDEFVTAYEMLSTPMDPSASREDIGQRLEAATLLSAVIPVAGVAGAGTKALLGSAGPAVDLPPQRTDLAPPPAAVDTGTPGPYPRTGDLDDLAGAPDPFVQTPFPFDEPEFNPNAFDPDFPAADFLDDFTPAAVGQGTNPVPLPDTLPASRFPDANPYNTDQGFAFRPLEWPTSAGIAGLYSRSARAADDLRQPAYGDINQLRRELESRGAPPKELDLQMGYLQELFEASPAGRVSAEDVQGVLGNAPGMSIVRTQSFAPIGPSSGQNYTSTVYLHPDVQQGPDNAYQHFDTTRPDGSRGEPPLLHTRAAQYQITPDGGPATTHHVLEIQSDWAQHRQALPSERPPLEERQRQARNLVRQGLVEEAENLVAATGLTRSEFDEQFPAPLVKNENDWVDAGVRQNLIDAVNSGSDWITFGNGRQASDHIGMPQGAAERFYDRQVPSSVERVLRKLSREAGTEVPTLQDVPFVDGQTVKGFPITPELREALTQSGLPSFRDGGMVTASEHLLDRH